MSRFETLAGKRVLVTGHTGFKGAWLSRWLSTIGAEVTGAALAPEAGRNLFTDAGLAGTFDSRVLDIRDEAAVSRLIDEVRPEVVLHLAAQSLVRESYARPIETFATNILGSAHVLQASAAAGAKAIVCVTTDKVYQNNEWVWPYRETDRLGGADPYSASKAGAEIVAAVYRDNLWAGGKGPAMATARGGNVIGGGDWSKDRLIPDIVRFVEAGAPIVIRSPRAIRPWQHVLELCRAYLTLAERLLVEPETAIGAWNFGPGPGGEADVETLVRLALNAFGRPEHEVRVEAASLKESRLLRLDISKVDAELGWRPVVPLEAGVGMTMDWYARFCADPSTALASMDAQIADYSKRL